MSEVKRHLTWFPNELGGDMLENVVREIDYDDAQSELAALREERDQWRQMVGRICSTIPLSDVLASTGTIQESVDYFKSLHTRLTVAEQRNAELVDLLRDLLPYLSDWNNPHRSAMRTRVDAAIKNTDAGMSASKPAAWANTSDLAAIAAGGLWSGTLWGGKNHPSFEPRLPLYTSPPAPVAVVLPEREHVHSKTLPFRNPAIGDGYISGWNACLDKVKELNQ